MDETLLGFQLRVVPKSLERWQSPRRAIYLLRESISVPLSVDKAVWPSSDDKRLLADLFSDYSSNINAAPNGLDVYSIKDSVFLNRPPEHAGSLLIGITAMGDVAQELRRTHHIGATLYSIADLKANGWWLVGYDVADRWLSSGLMNCGYTPDQKTVLSTRFGSRLNNHGLFDDPEAAQDFCVACNDRIPEHAPFVVYGIWSNSDLELEQA
jgi:hypothetical protein